MLKNLSPKTVLTIIMWLIIVWILCRPLKGIGKSVYHVLGSTSNYTFQSILNFSTTIKELIESKELVDEQAKSVVLMKIRINELEDELKEVTSLKNLLNLKHYLGYQTVPCNVTGRTSDNWHKQIILDKGKDYNIQTGNSVLSQNGVIGQIIEADKNHSVAQLISDSAYKVGCKIKNRNIYGILSGKTNSVGVLEFIPVGSEVMLGDLVVTSGLRAKDLVPTYPAGHPVGTVIKISKKKIKASDLYIEVKLSCDLNSVINVLVFSPKS